MSSRQQSRRFALPLALVTAAALVLTGCAGDSESSPASSDFGTGNSAYDAIINGGAVASDDVIAASEWATAVKESGTLRVGGTETSKLFSLLDPTTGVAVGFDAGLSQLLAKYILGTPSTELTQVTADTREEVLENSSVDVVFATYSITPTRLERIDFAGPYYESQAGILVAADNSDITGVDDLAGTTVATQSGSTGPDLIAEFAPDAEVLELPDNAQALQAVEQGRADAYVTDQSLLLSNLIDNDAVKLVGDGFGPSDPYGIGLKKGSDAQEFIDTWLQSIIDDGTWLKLWQATIQAQTGATVEPTTPVIGSAGN